MKLTLFLSMFTIIQLCATESYSQLTKLTLKLEDVKLSDALKQIESKSEFFFLYSPKLIDVERKVNIEADKESIKDILSNIFDDKVKFVAYDRQIILTPGDLTSPSKSMQQQKITGTVTDAKTGEPLPGVNIVVQGTTTGTNTDINGKYYINIPDANAVLVFTYISYVNQAITVGNQTTINVALSEDAKTLDEVVVVGYGTQKKINLTGAVTQVNAEAFQERPISNMTQALQGVIPNLNVVFGDGKPGQSGALNIRGNTSINGGTPLVIIDGVPGVMDRINVNDVESVSVLKDASASAIYGARATFGVILVTTKNPVKGKTNITYSNNFGWKTFATNTNYMTNGYEYAKITDEAMYNALGNTYLRYSTEDYAELEARKNDLTENPDRPWVVIKPNASGKDMYRYYGNFDWFNYMFLKWRPKSEHTLSVSGSTDKIRYLVTGTTSKEDGVFRINTDNYTRNNFRTKIDADVTKWLKISNNTSFFKSNYSWYGLKDNFYVSQSSSTTNAFYFLAPVYMPHNPDGTRTGLTGLNSYSIGYGLPAIMENGKSKGENNISDFGSTFEANIKIMKGLTVTANYTYQQENLYDYYRAVRVNYSLYPGVLTNFALATANQDNLEETLQNNTYHVINIFGNYEKSIKDHNFKAIVGFNQELKKYKKLYGFGSELLSETLNDLNFVTGTNRVSGGASEWALRGVFYRLNYDYAGKYLFETSARYDGTSRFSKKDRFGFFPSLSVGWRISEENFFSPVKEAVNNLKIRASYGTLGNQQVPTYAYIPNMSTNQINYLVGGQKLNVVNNPAPVAPTLTWEASTTYNIGLDADFLKNRLSFTGDVYIRDTKGMLAKGKTLPAVFGATEPSENAASLRTKGFELTLSWKDEVSVAGSPLTYSIRGILSDYTSKITKFDNPNKLLTNYYEGQQLGEIWGYSYDGFFKTLEEAQAYAAIVNQDLINTRRVEAPTADLRLLQAGDIKILDLDGNGIIDQGANTVDDPGDRRIIGNSQPRYSYGFTVSTNWKGFGVSAFFQGIGKKDWYPLISPQFWGPHSSPYLSFIRPDIRELTWSPENPNSYFPFLRGYNAQNSELAKNNDMYLQNTAYCKLKNLTIEYVLPATLLKKVNISRCRVYVSGENLFTWTKMDTNYIDPEETMSDVSTRLYPVSKTYSVGFEVTF